MPAAGPHAAMQAQVLPATLGSPVLKAPLLPPAPLRVQVAAMQELDHWRLYLVDWGYNTAPERAVAEANQRIEVVDIARFSQLAGLPAPAAAAGSQQR